MGKTCTTDEYGMKTDIEIQKWVYHRIKGTDLQKTATGTLSDRGRPDGSEKEDIVISVLAGDGAGQIQQVYVNVNIYIKDLWNDSRKAWERDTIRVDELCGLSKFLFSLFGDGFSVSAKDSAQRVMPAGVRFQDGHTEHLINNRLFIRICNE